MHDLNNKEINIVELWRMLLKHKLLIIGITITTTLLASMFTLSRPDIYKAETLLLPVSVVNKGFVGRSLEKSGVLIAALGGGAGSGHEVDKAILVAKTHDFLVKFINKYNLKKILFEERFNNNGIELGEKSISDLEAYEMLGSMLDIETVPDSAIGATKLTISWKNPITVGNVSKIANLLVVYINQESKRETIGQSKKAIMFLKEEINQTSIVEMKQSLYQLMKSEVEKIMLANIRKAHIFNVINSAKTPSKPNKRNDAILIFLSFIFGLILSVFIAITLNTAMQNSSHNIK